MPPPSSPTPGPRNKRILRYSTIILPRTGERVRRELTLPALGDNSVSAANGDGLGLDGEQSPLLPRARRSPSLENSYMSRLQRTCSAVVNFAKSTTGQGILKCSLAYLLGSLATFVPGIASLLGKQDGKHVVATVTVYFHPARSAGSMLEAVILALLAFLYAMVISFTSMGITILMANLHLLALGHAIVLIVFCGGGLGFVGWLKQSLGRPLVNVACSLASLAIITTLTKEGSVQTATFSEEKVVQVLKMVILGITATTLVCLVVLPISARKELNKDLTKATDLLGDVLVAISRAFLSGREVEMQDPLFKTVTKDHQASMNTMKKNLSEARWEHYFLGTENQYRIEAQLVKCLQKMSQDLGGLRSAALTQFDLIKVTTSKNHKGSFDLSRSSSFLGPMTMSQEPDEDDNGLGRIDEETEYVERSPLLSDTPATGASPITPFSNGRGTQTPADMFTTFILQLGPSMKALAFTLKQILDELPFNDESSCRIAVNTNFHASLNEAVVLFKDARRKALASLYRNKDLYKMQSVEKVADFEEVAASCGHFSFAILDFAEDTLSYLNILEDLKIETERSPRRRSWHWLKIWRKFRSEDEPDGKADPLLQDQDEDRGFSQIIPAPIKRADDFADPAKIAQRRPWSYRIWKALRWFRRDDIRFAIKVGIGAALFALPSFLESTRPTFQHFRGEWGLVSYMVVCSMTIGASNTTGIERFLGTGIGALVAILSWIVADENPWLLGFLGWLVSLGCFYVILGQGRGPMGRFILLTYNLSALYAYSLSARDDDDDEDEGGINPEIWEIVFHRVVSVIAGAIWAIIVTRLIWPISARKKLKNGICVLWLRMSMIWKRDPLAMFLLGEPTSVYMDIREEAELHSFLQYLETLRKAAISEYELKGPFPDVVVGKILERTARMLDNFHAMNVVISKDLKASPGEALVLRFTRNERFALSARISHLFSVLASSVKMEYPLNDVLPSIENSRDRLLARIFEFRRSADGGVATDQDYELLYAYALVTGQLAQDITAVGLDLEELYGTLNEENLKLQ